MIHSNSERLKKLVQTDDGRLFYLTLNPPEEYSDSQIPIKPQDSLQNSGSSKKNGLKKQSSIEYKIGNYLIQQTLGEGTFGKTKLGIYLPNNEKVAIKILEKERMKDNDDKVRVKREFDMLSKFNHPNVILVTEIFESVDSYYSVMEYCEGGELFNYIVEKKRLSEKESAFYYYQIINGLEYIHSLGIVHRDLKPENLLLTKDHLLKIIDFGLSNYFIENQTELLRTPCGSPCYASPEMVAGKKYNGIKIDIWATGIILFAMLCGYLPFEDKNNEKLFDKILECKIEYPDFLSEESKDLIKKILVIEPEKRITIPEIKKHKFYLKGKRLFNEIFTIKQIDNVSENNNKEKKENIENKENEEKKDNKENKDENKKENKSIEKLENDKVDKVDIIDKEVEVDKMDIIDNTDNIDNIDKTDKVDNNNKKESENKLNNESNELNELMENKENINIENIKININNIANIDNNQNIKNEKDNNKIINNDNNKIIKNKEKESRNFNNNKIDNKNSKIEKLGEIKDKDKDTINKQKINKKPKELNCKYIQYVDKRANYKKINITDNSPKKNKNSKNISALINNNKIKNTKTPEIRNKKTTKSKEKSKIDKPQNNILIETMSKERNTMGSLGSSVVETFNNQSQQTNITNFMVNNIHYNVNISFENSKRAYSHENTKDATQNEQTTKNNINNTISHNNVSHHTTTKNSNNIYIIDNNTNTNNNINNINNYNKSNNKVINNNNCLFNHFNYNNKKANYNKIRNNNPNKIKKYLKDIRGTKQYYNSDNIKRTKQDLIDFNICKLINESNIKKTYNEFLLKQYGDNSFINKNNNKSKSTNKDKYYYTNRTNHANIKNISYNKGNNKMNNISTNLNDNKKDYFKKVQNYKNINININTKNISSSKNKNLSTSNKKKYLSTINNKNTKNKYKKLIIKPSNLINKSNINKKKKVNKLQYNNLFNQVSIEDDSNLNIQTEPNIKNNFTKVINKLTKNNNKKNNSKNVESKKVNNINNVNKSNINTSKKKNIDSPLKKGKIRQKLIKNSNNQFINSSNKKQFETINNIIANYKVYKPDFISISTNINKTIKKNITKIKRKKALHVNNYKENESLNKIIEKTSKSIEVKNNKNEKKKYINKKDEKQNNISCINNNNLKRSEIISSDIKKAIRTPNQSKSRTKIISKKKDNTKNKNEILIISTERNTDYEKKRITNNNKFKNIYLKNNEEINDMKNVKNRLTHIRAIKRIPNINNNKDKLLNIHKNKTHINFIKDINNIVSYNTKNLTNNAYLLSNINKNHLKFKSMKLTDIYKNHIKNNNKLRTISILDKIKTNNSNINNINYDLKNAFIKNIDNKNHSALSQQHIIYIKNYDDNKIIKNNKK